MDPTDDRRETEDSLLNNTRRQFVAGSAGALGGLAAGAGLVGPSLAQEDDEDDAEDDEEADDGEDEEEEPIENEFEDDVDILNYARTLELLEARFYQQGLENISEEEFCTCGVLSEDSPLTERVYGELETIQSHEESHAETLATAVEELGGEPVEEPEFDFGLAVEYPIAFLATAVQIEDIGVSAYAGAAPFIENEDLLAPALGIHSVEARHAAFLRTLRDETSFPDVVDEARSRSEVLDLIGEFIVDEEAEDDEEEEDAEDEEEDEAEDDEDGIGEDDDDGIGDDVGDDEGVGNETDDGDGIGNDTDGTGDGVGNDTDGTGDGIGNDTDGAGNDTDGTGAGNETGSIGL